MKQSALLIFGYIAICLSACKKSGNSPVPGNPGNPGIPQTYTVTTLFAHNITDTTAQSGGTVTTYPPASIYKKGVCWNTDPAPTLTNPNTNEGVHDGSFNSFLTGLSRGTIYNIRAYAIYLGGTSYGDETSFCTTAPPNTCWTGTVADIDGNIYHTINIGTQVWMIENLRTSRYRNGQAITTSLSAGSWNNTTSGAFTYYNNSVALNPVMGKLYNWYAVTDPRNICPPGYHIPTIAEWNTLINFLGGATVAGGKMKSANYWSIPNTGATNSSCFTAVAGGYCFNTQNFLELGKIAAYWSTTQNDPTSVQSMTIGFHGSNSNAGVAAKTNGLSIRCIKD